MGFTQMKSITTNEPQSAPYQPQTISLSLSLSRTHEVDPTLTDLTLLQDKRYFRKNYKKAQGMISQKGHTLHSLANKDHALAKRKEKRMISAHGQQRIK